MDIPTAYGYTHIIWIYPHHMDIPTSYGYSRYGGTANPTWGDISECCFKAQSSKLERLFSSKRGKRDVRASSFGLSKMSPQVGLAVHTRIYMYTYVNICIYTIYGYIFNLYM